LGIDARIVTLAWERSPLRAQAGLRMRRYAALCDLARRHGAEWIALAHTADDQAETVFMRAAHGSGWRGLAGMQPAAPAPIWPEGRGLMAARPLLDCRRAELRAWLTARGEAWIEDPSNEMAVYERVRVRRRLTALDANGFYVARLARLADRLRPLARALDLAASAWLGRVQIEMGRASVPQEAFDGSEAAAWGLSALIAAIAGAPAAPSPARTARLLAAAARRDFRGATLGGAHIAPHGRAISIQRDAGALLGRADLPPAKPLILPLGEPTTWDGRLLVRTDEPGWRISAAGEEPDPTAPLLRRGSVKLRLDQARGAFAFEWLTNAHLKHLLPAFTPG